MLLKLSISLLLLSLAGCSYDAVQRVGYFVIGNLHQNQCQMAMATACPEPSYDEYQRRRQEVSGK